jgi:protein phosphatase
VRDGRLEQLTADHSLVAELLRSGRLTQEEADTHPHRSVITRALGTDPEVDVDTITVALQPGDLFLLCSDGLTTMVRDEDILAIVAAAAHDPARAAAMLVKAANEAGGEDNITAVLFEVVDGEPGGPREHAHSLTAVPEPTGGAEPPEAGLPPAPARRWGAAAGSRWPALLLLASLFGVGAFVVIWSVAR